MGFVRSEVVLADRSRLQKSTGGARPIAPAGEEPADTTTGLAPPCESIGGAKKRRKPDPSGKAGRPVAGSQQPSSTRKRGLREHSVDGRRSGPGKPSSIDDRVVEAVLAPRKTLGQPSGQRGATRASEVLVANPARGRKHRGSGSPTRTWGSARLRNERSAVSNEAKARCAPSSAHRPGAVPPQSGAVPRARMC